LNYLLTLVRPAMFHVEQSLSTNGRLRCEPAPRKMATMDFPAVCH
jgi:hypothetical protein